MVSHKKTFAQLPISLSLMILPHSFAINMTLVNSPILVSLPRHRVTPDGELVLLQPRHAELGRQSIARHPHHLPGGVVRDRGRLQRDVLHFQPLRQVPYGPERSPLLHCLGQGDQLLPDGTREADGNVAERLGSAGDHARGLPAQDLLGGARDGDARGDACLFGKKTCVIRSLVFCGMATHRFSAVRRSRVGGATNEGK